MSYGCTLPYHEQEDIENIQKLIRGMSERAATVLYRLSSAALNLVHQRAPGLRMPMI